MSVTLPVYATACDLTPAHRHNAIRLLDARTIELDNNTTIRLAAILPPTSYDSPAAPADFPPQKNARAALLHLIKSRILAIAEERAAPDRYGRTIAHAFIEPPQEPAPAARRTAASRQRQLQSQPLPERWLQARLVRAGHARVALTPETSPPCARHLLTLEADAERHRRGLWREALYQARPATDPRALLKLRSTFQIVTGHVHAVAVRKTTVYLNFAEDWRRDFTVRITKRILKRAGVAPENLKRLTGRPIRVRGWIERRGGPLITVWRLEQIEIVTQSPASRSARPPDLFLATDLDAATPLPDPAPLPESPGTTASGNEVNDTDAKEKAPAPK